MWFLFKLQTLIMSLLQWRARGSFSKTPIIIFREIFILMIHMGVLGTPWSHLQQIILAFFISQSFFCFFLFPWVLDFMISNGLFKTLRSRCWIFGLISECGANCLWLFLYRIDAIKVSDCLSSSCSQVLYSSDLSLTTTLKKKQR